MIIKSTIIIMIVYFLSRKNSLKFTKSPNKKSTISYHPYRTTNKCELQIKIYELEHKQNQLCKEINLLKDLVK